MIKQFKIFEAIKWYKNGKLVPDENPVPDEKSGGFNTEYYIDNNIPVRVNREDWNDFVDEIKDDFVWSSGIKITYDRFPSPKNFIVIFFYKIGRKFITYSIYSKNDYPIYPALFNESVNELDPYNEENWGITIEDVLSYVLKMRSVKGFYTTLEKILRDRQTGQLMSIRFFSGDVLFIIGKNYPSETIIIQYQKPEEWGEKEVSSMDEIWDFIKSKTENRIHESKIKWYHKGKFEIEEISDIPEFEVGKKVSSTGGSLVYWDDINGNGNIELVGVDGDWKGIDIFIRGDKIENVSYCQNAKGYTGTLIKLRYWPWFQTTNIIEYEDL
jgi:hypothetical protein